MGFWMFGMQVWLTFLSDCAPDGYDEHADDGEDEYSQHTPYDWIWN